MRHSLHRAPLVLLTLLLLDYCKSDTDAMVRTVEDLRAGLIV